MTPAADVPATDIPAEVGVLGAVLLEPNIVAPRLFSELVPEDFYSEAHRMIVRAMLAVLHAGRPLDKVTLAAELTARGELDYVGGWPRLLQLELDGTIPAYVPHYCAQVLEAANKRRLKAAGLRLTELASNGSASDDVVATIGRELEAIRVRTPSALGGPQPKVLVAPPYGARAKIEADWIVENVFSHRNQHMIPGASQSAKTWLLKQLALAIAHDDVDAWLGQPVRRHGVVVLESWEDGQAEDLRKLSKLARGLGLQRSSSNLILISDTPSTLSDAAYFDRRRRELVEWGAIAYLVDSLSQAAGIDLNDNQTYSEWWRSRVKPLLDAGIMVVFTHLKGHVKPGVGANRDAASRGATQIRALSTGVVELRQLEDVRFQVKHNKHRDGTALPFGMLQLDGRLEDDFVRLVLKAEDTAATKEAVARRLLRELGAAQAEDAVLDRKAIEAALNGRERPKTERVSRKTWEPVLAELTEAGLFQASKRGNAAVWRWIGEDAPEEDADAPF